MPSCVKKKNTYLEVCIAERRDLKSFRSSADSSQNSQNQPELFLFVSSAPKVLLNSSPLHYCPTPEICTITHNKHWYMYSHDSHKVMIVQSTVQCWINNPHSSRLRAWSLKIEKFQFLAQLPADNSQWEGEGEMRNVLFSFPACLRNVWNLEWMEQRLPAGDHVCMRPCCCVYSKFKGYYTIIF